MMLKLKLQYFGHLMQRTDSSEKTLMLRKIEGRRRRDNRGWDDWMASPAQWTWVWVDSGSWWWTGRPGMLWFMGSQRVWHNWVTELNWTDHKKDKSWRGCRERGTLCTIGGNVNWCNHYGKEYESPSKNFQVELPYGPVISLLEIYPEEIKTKILKKYQHSCVLCSIIYNHQEM